MHRHRHTGNAQAEHSNGAPAGDRYLAVAPDLGTRLLAVDAFLAADESGNLTALRDATIGKLYGLNVVESAALTAGTAIAYYSSAFAFGNRPPTPPAGGVDSTTATEGGISLRSVITFDATRLSSISVVSVFAGAAAVAENAAGTTIRRAIKIGTATA